MSFPQSLNYSYLLPTWFYFLSSFIFICGKYLLYCKKVQYSKYSSLFKLGSYVCMFGCGNDSDEPQVLEMTNCLSWQPRHGCNQILRFTLALLPGLQLMISLSTNLLIYFFKSFLNLLISHNQLSPSCGCGSSSSQLTLGGGYMLFRTNKIKREGKKEQGQANVTPIIHCFTALHLTHQQT